MRLFYITIGVKETNKAQQVTIAIPNSLVLYSLRKEIINLNIAHKHNNNYNENRLNGIASTVVAHLKKYGRI